MGNGYTPGRIDDEARTRALFEGIMQRLSELERPTGTSVNSLVTQVQDAIANINTTVNNAIATNSYTKTQIDSKIASPGAIAPTDVTASGQVSSNGSPLKSQPSFNYVVATGYKGAWIDGVTFQIGISPSTERVKTDLTPMGTDDAAKLLSLTPYWGRYVWDDPDSPPKVFLLAGDVQAAGFGPDVAPVVTGDPVEMYVRDEPVIVNGEPVVIPTGEADSVNYSQLVVPLLALGQAQEARIAELEARLTAAGIA